jgi:hypothetical protein
MAKTAMHSMHLMGVAAFLAAAGCGFPEPTFDKGIDASQPVDGQAPPDGSEDQQGEASPDGPVSEAEASAAEAGDSEAAVEGDSGCSTGQKQCGAECVAVDNPAWGCAPSGCTPCSLSHAKATCDNGDCVVASCDTGWKDCNTTDTDGCEADTTSSASDCGNCGNACVFQHAAATCSSGQCVMGACDQNYADCNSLATDGCEGNLAADPNHCGTCATVCQASPGTPVCNQGVCGVSNCPTGVGDCNKDPGDGCETDLTASTANCGFCGNVCSFVSADPACTAGQCHLAQCHAGSGDCDFSDANGCETNTNTSTQNCGACGTKCPTPVNAVSTCQSGACGYHCLAAYGDCNSQAADGCEINVTSDAANCGTCGFACSFAHATAQCASSLCTLGGCAQGWANCDTNSANGCEAELATSAQHCGACGHVCAGGANATATCGGGVCGLQCTSGWADCDSNPANGCEHVKTSYKDVVLADAPVAYWRLGETAGTTLADSSGHGLSLAVHASPELGAPGALYCDPDKAIRFVSAAGGWAGRGTTAALEPKTAISIELWMLQTGTTSEYEKPLWYGDASAIPWGSWGLQREATAQTEFAFLVNLGGTASWVHSLAFTKKDTWYHVVLTYDGAWQRFFVNGANTAEKAATGTITYNNKGQAFAIGACDLPWAFLTGSVDEVAIYDKALTEQRVLAHYMAGAP